MKLSKVENLIAKLWPLIFVIVLVGIFFWRFVFLGYLPIPSDTIVGLYHPWRDIVWDGFANGVPFKNFLITDPVRQEFPWRFLAIENLKNGVLPNWNPYSFAGTPLLANFQSAVFSPFNFLFWFLRFNTAWGVLILLQPLLAGIFTYFFLRGLKLSRLPSFVGSICFSFAGFSIAWLEWGTIGHTLLWLPLILLSIEKILAQSGIKFSIWSLVFIFSLVSSFFGGHLQVFFYVFGFSFIYLIWRAFQFKGSRLKLIILFVISFSMFILVTSIQWLPTLRFINLSAREVDQLSWQAPGWFAPWQHLAQFFAPDFFGNPSTLNYWGVWNYGELVGFIGVISIILVFLGLFILKNRYSVFFSLIFLLILSFALPTPWAKIPFQLHVPFLSTSQPTRLLGLIDFCLAVLTGFGLEAVLRNKASLKRLLMPLLVYVGLWLFTFFSHLPKVNLAVSQRNLVLPTLIFVIGSLLIFLLKNKMFLRLSAGLLVFTVCFDLLRFSWKFTPFVKESYLFPSTKTIEFLKKDQDVFRIMATDRRIFPPNFSVAYKLQTVDGYDPLYLLRYGELVAAWERNRPDISPPFGFNRIITPQNYSSKIADLLNIKYVLSLTDLESSKLELVFREGETRVYKNKNVSPRAFVVYNYVKAKDKQEAIELLLNKGTDLRKEVILEESLTDWPVGEAQPAISKLIIEEYKANSVAIGVKLPQRGILVLTDSYYPGWVATVDDRPTHIYLANYNFRAIVIPEGDHKIVFSYGN